jgi:branched-chain amino acid aminotransferase
MVLLNQWGRVAEATGACVLMVRDGTVYSTPPTEGALESMTLDITEALARSLNIPFVRRPIDRTELLVADEISICGTLAELTLVRSIDGQPLAEKEPILGGPMTVTSPEGADASPATPANRERRIFVGGLLARPRAQVRG